MNLDRLVTFFTTNPSARLLRATHAAYIVHFLHQHFKADGNLATPHGELREALARYLDHLHETHPEALERDAETYLQQWATGDTRWLRRYYDAQHAESVYQLTHHAEDVLKFLIGILERTLGFVGAESRLTRIIETLNDLAVRGSDDRDRRLRHLREERDEIDREIASLEAGDEVATHTPTAIRERFADVVNDLVSLQGDFRAVEESFKGIIRGVQKQQTELAGARGEILGFALDAEDRLKQEDQGVSFDAFKRLILSQTQQDQLEEIIAQLDEIVELAEQVEGKRRVQGMVASLSAEARNVLETTRRLSATLRRLLDSQAGATRRRLATLLAEIKAAAVRRAENPPTVGVDVFAELDLLGSFERTFWQAPVEFDDLELANNEPDDDDRQLAFRQLAELERLDWDAMRSHVAALAGDSGRVTLPELLEEYPPSSGGVEVLGYVQLAHDDGHDVDYGLTDIVQLAGPRGPRDFEIPRVLFLAQPLRELASAVEAEGDAP